MATDYLTLDEVVAIHDALIADFGGVYGVRDIGLLEAALARPQSGYYDDIIAEAAALWESLSQNHPFVDGNKRTAFDATFAFLDINGVQITADTNDAWNFIDSMYKRNGFTFEAIDAWLRDNTKNQRRS